MAVPSTQEGNGIEFALTTGEEFPGEGPTDTSPP
jgi:hypothetical protein